MSLVPVGYLGESGFCGDGNIHLESTVFLYSFSTSTRDGGSTMVRTDDYVFGTQISSMPSTAHT